MTSLFSRFQKQPKAEPDDDDQKSRVSIIQVEVNETAKEFDRKKRTQEDMVTDFVTILEQMMNPRQAVTSFVSAVTGLIAISVGSIYIYYLPDTAVKAHKLVTVLIIYGILQILLATAYFATCVQTSIAVFKGVKDSMKLSHL
ncbi:hypothetical protein DICVIV_05552 [Dictyocaulus viviparus]|uniref:Uncharacterized protein n=1 Tax=Dictyocaulus viviparus TaxID=29172 RepID=A0A0D8Y138_DICVI|nr:hypothetical protein DICVIV_05552 [Dictyocaulus viviparus]